MNVQETSSFSSTISLPSIQSAERWREFGTGIFVTVAVLVMTEVHLPQCSVSRGENKKF